MDLHCDKLNKDPFTHKICGQVGRLCRAGIGVSRELKFPKHFEFAGFSFSFFTSSFQPLSLNK